MQICMLSNMAGGRSLVLKFPSHSKKYDRCFGAFAMKSESLYSKMTRNVDWTLKERKR